MVPKENGKVISPSARKRQKDLIQAHEISTQYSEKKKTQLQQESRYENVI